MRERTLRILALLVILAVAGSGGCASLDIIKKRLAPPHPVAGGILFQYEAPEASIVTLAGDWDENEWGGTASATGRYDNTIGRMNDDDDDGIWRIVVDLPPGRYQYKFVVDINTWVTDPSNPDTVNNGGFTNSLLIVK